MESPVHIVRRWPCGGGMQSVVEQHLRAGEPLVSITGEGEGTAGVTHLGVHPGTSLREASRRLHEALEAYDARDYLFYNACALDWMRPRDGHHRHIIYLHSDYPELISWLRKILPYADGLLTVNPRIAESVRQMGNLPEKAVHTLPLAIQTELPAAHEPPGPDAPLVVGYAGRVEISQKRLDRLPPFLTELERCHRPYRMEILGDGHFKEKLRRQLAGNTHVIFHGHLEGSAYWNVLSGWKYLLFTSDYEGLPISLLEGISAGAVPIYPDFHDGQDWISGLGNNFLYPVGDMVQANAVVQDVEKNWTAADWQAYHAQSGKMLEAHSPEGYFSAMNTAIDTLPPPGTVERPRAAFTGWWPYWMYNRLRRMRQFGTLRPAS